MFMRLAPQVRRLASLTIIASSALGVGMCSDAWAGTPGSDGAALVTNSSNWDRTTGGVVGTDSSNWDRMVGGVSTDSSNWDRTVGGGFATTGSSNWD
jgi:hypothetical protein